MSYDTLEKALDEAKAWGYPLVERTPAAERELDPGVNRYKYYVLEFVEEEYHTPEGDGKARYYEVYGFDTDGSIRHLAAICKPDGRCLECRTYVAVEETYRYDGLCRKCWEAGLTDEQAAELREERRSLGDD